MAHATETTASTSQVRWFLVFWIFILAAIAFLDRVNIAIAGGSIASAYGLTNIQLGSIFSALLWGYALFQTVGGRLADRLGPRRVLSAGVLWWGLFTALTALVPQKRAVAIFWLISTRFLLGAGEAVMFPASNQFISRWIPFEERGLANGLIFAGVGVGAGLSPPLISYLTFHYGWRFSFWFCAGLGLLAGSLWYGFSRDTPQEHRGVSRKELAFIHAGLTLATDSGSPAQPGKIKLVAWRKVLTSKDVLAVTLSYFTFGYLAWIFFSWFYIYLAQARGLNLKASAFYAMLPALAMALFSLVGGKISDTLTRWRGPRLGRSLLAAAAFILAAVFVGSGALVANAGTASLVLAGGAGALYLAQSSFWSVTASLAGHSSGSVSGFMNMGAQVGGAVTAQVTPWIAARFGWSAAFLVAAALALFGAVAWLFVNPETRLAEAETRETAPLPANRSALAATEGFTGSSRI